MLGGMNITRYPIARRGRARGGPGRAVAGFSVVEILIVIALVGIALALVLPNLQTSLAQGRLETHRNIAVEINKKIGDFVSSGGSIGSGANVPTAVQVTQFLATATAAPGVARTVGSVPVECMADGPITPFPMSQNVVLSFPRGAPAASAPAVDTQFVYDGVTYLMNATRTAVTQVSFGSQTATLP